MKTCIVTVESLDDGIYQEWRGLSENVVGHFERTGWDANEVPHAEMMKRVKTWYCAPQDTTRVVEYMSNHWTGTDIKVFNLTAVSIRLPGDLKHKSVTKDGVLPT